MDKQTYTSALSRTCAQKCGLVVGIIWAASFLCYMYGMKNEWLMAASLPLGIMSLFYVGRIAGGFMTIVEDTTTRRTWTLILMSYFFASLLTTLAQYVYFAYLDHGMFADSVQKAMETPEMQAVIKQYPEGALEEGLKMLDKPSAMATTMFAYNIAIGFILSIPSLIYALTIHRRNLRYMK